MKNLISADFYRTKKMKSLYVVAGVCVLFAILTLLLYKGMGILADVATQQDVLPAGFEDLSSIATVLQETFGSATAFSMAKEILVSDTLIYCLIAIFLAVSATEFSSSTLKNTLVSGISRKDVYFSKLAVSSLYTIAYYLVFFVSAILGSMLVYWECPTAGEFATLLLIAIKQIPIYLGVIAAGHCFVFITQSAIGAVALYLVTFTMFNTILPVLNMVSPWDIKITLLFPLYQCIELTYDNVAPLSYAVIYGSTLLYFILFTWTGYRKFKKAEIK
jgi:ABC-type transport system involved in multi-copper enzyme maturation permease subunit